MPTNPKTRKRELLLSLFRRPPPTQEVPSTTVTHDILMKIPPPPPWCQTPHMKRISLERATTKERFSRWNYSLTCFTFLRSTSTLIHPLCDPCTLLPINSLPDLEVCRKLNEQKTDGRSALSYLEIYERPFMKKSNARLNIKDALRQDSQRIP
eukprot:scaffold235397_cov45-Attheya_sp.AAC.1